MLRTGEPWDDREGRPYARMDRGEVAVVAGKEKRPKKRAGRDGTQAVPYGEAGKKTGEASEAGKKPKAGKKAFRYPGRGAPKIYADAEALAKGCEKYFASISLVEELKNPVTGEPERSSLGKPIERVVWLVQPSMGALARSLGISDRTLRNYAEDTEDPGGTGNTKAAVVEWAKDICRDWLLEQVTTREKGSLNGLIFVLQNNFGMKEQLSVEHSGTTLEEWIEGKEQSF